MTYEPVPGTIPYRVVGWLKAQAKATGNLYGEYSSVEIGSRLELDCADDFPNYLRRARERGAVHSRKDGRTLYWRLGDGTPDPQFGASPEVVAYDAAVDEKEPCKPPGFRAMRWRDHLLVAGVEVRDGVAIFKPEQVMKLKAQTDWWAAA